MFETFVTLNTVFKLSIFVPDLLVPYIISKSCSFACGLADIRSRSHRGLQLDHPSQLNSALQ